LNPVIRRRSLAVENNDLAIRLVSLLNQLLQKSLRYQAMPTDDQGVF
jgi:hypothetical protein